MSPTNSLSRLKAATWYFSAKTMPSIRPTSAPFALCQSGDHVLGEGQVDQPGLGGEVAAVGDAVGLGDARVADEAGEPPSERGVCPGRRRPAQLRDLTASRGDVVGKALQADVGHPEVLLE